MKSARPYLEISCLKVCFWPKIAPGEEFFSVSSGEIRSSIPSIKAWSSDTLILDSHHEQHKLNTTDCNERNVILRLARGYRIETKARYKGNTSHLCNWFKKKKWYRHEEPNPAPTDYKSHPQSLNINSLTRIILCIFASFGIFAGYLGGFFACPGTDSIKTIHKYFFVMINMTDHPTNKLDLLFWWVSLAYASWS